MCKLTVKFTYLLTPFCVYTALVLVFNLLCRAWDTSSLAHCVYRALETIFSVNLYEINEMNSVACSTG